MKKLVKLSPINSIDGQKITSQDESIGHAYTAAKSAWKERRSLKDQISFFT